MRILSTLAVQSVVGELLPVLRAEAGVALDLVFEPTALLLQRLSAGEPADIAILTSAGIDALAQEGLLDAASKVDVAVSKVGIAVKHGAPKPDIATPQAVRALLLAVPSLCYSRAGASGIFFTKVIRELGIAEAIAHKATVIASGFTAEQVANGRCAIAIQQVSELLVVPGVDIVGPLPEPIQECLMFSAAVARAARDQRPAAGVLRALVRPGLAGLYARHGLDLAGGESGVVPCS